MKNTLLMLMSIFCLDTLASAQGTKPSESIDNVLDRLERKLMEQEASSLRLNPITRINPEKPAQQIMNLPPQAIAAPLPEQKNFNVIEQQLKELEQETDELSGQVEKLKADFQLAAGRASLVEMVVELAAPDETALRDLSFSINNHNIYRLENGEGPWLPGKQILLYTGPLEPGEHFIQLKGKSIRRYAEGLPLDQNLYHRYDQSFCISIPQGAYRKGYRFKLAKPEAQNIHAEAVLENYEIP